MSAHEMDALVVLLLAPWCSRFHVTCNLFASKKKIERINAVN